jgi:L-aspartate oxidase
MIPRYIESFDTGDIATLKCDVLVCGSGVAGLSTALHLAEHFDVLLVTKSDLQASSTRHAQGGIAAVMDEHDNADSHIRDTLIAGAGLSDPETTAMLVREGPARIIELLDGYGVEFDMTDGRLDLSLEGGHSFRRVVHARGDATGSEVESALGRAVMRSPRIRVMEETFISDLLLDDGRCAGALALDESNRIFSIAAGATVLASGGMGQLYLVTTNPRIATGDGVAMAFRAGARVSDLEFFQFHPTALHIPEEPKFLISEALRGAGAWLVDMDGNRVMDGIHPLGELAPRDIVVARMVEVMKEQGQNHLYLDVRHIDSAELKRRFPHIYQHCLEAGIDITRHLIPVSPAAHYMSGGVVTDEWGRTDVPSLFACGEVACTGVHGANRLASNSLLEGLVFAKRISDLLAGELAPGTSPAIPHIAFKPDWGRPRVSGTLLTGFLRELMRDQVGMVRCERGLKQTLELLDGNNAVLETGYHDQHSLELKNMLLLAILIATAAEKRTESRGCHRRRDFPDLDDWNWHKHLDMRMAGGRLLIAPRPQKVDTLAALKVAGG